VVIIEEVQLQVKQILKPQSQVLQRIERIQHHQEEVRISQITTVIHLQAEVQEQVQEVLAVHQDHLLQHQEVIQNQVQVVEVATEVLHHQVLQAAVHPHLLLKHTQVQVRVAVEVVVQDLIHHQAEAPVQDQVPEVHHPAHEVQVRHPAQKALVHHPVQEVVHQTEDN